MSYDPVHPSTQLGKLQVGFYFMFSNVFLYTLYFFMTLSGAIWVCDEYFAGATRRGFCG